MGQGRVTYLDGNLMNEAICSLRLDIPRWALGRHSDAEVLQQSDPPLKKLAPILSG